MKRLPLLTFGSILLAIPAIAACDGVELKKGDPAPPFSLKASDGKTYSLSDFKGKKAIVIAWFPKAFTGGCTQECKSFREDGAAIQEFDVAYFTASVDEPEVNKKFAASLQLDYPILSDPEGDVARAYGVIDALRPLPRRWTFIIGLDGKILHVDKEVKTGSHAKDVAGKLSELGIPKAESGKAAS